MAMSSGANECNTKNIFNNFLQLKILSESKIAPTHQDITWG